MRAIKRATWALPIGALVFAGATAALAGPKERARAILTETGVTGGLVVHVGCGDGRLTQALAEREGVLVHGLDSDADAVAETRARLQAVGAYGKVALDHWEGGRLPYTDNLVRLLVVEDGHSVAEEEAERVACPGGVLYARQGGKWEMSVKTTPGTIDDWGHSLYDATNNAVSRDMEVGPPYHLQWLADPKHARHHERLASISVVVSAGGRLFSIVDEAPAASILLRPRWALIARDAYSGVVLWKRGIASWESHLRGFRSGPADLPRRLVATPERVYVTLGYDDPVAALDPATGETLHTYEGTDRAQELIHSGRVLYLVIGPPKGESARRTGEEPATPVMAVEATTGEVLWRREDLKPLPTTLAHSGERLFLVDPEGVRCLAADTGQDVWHTPREVAGERPGWSAPTLVAHEDVVLCADRDVEPTLDVDPKTGEKLARWLTAEGCSGELVALSADSGQQLWRVPAAESYHAPIDVFVADGLVWVGQSGARTNADFTDGRDLHTGEVKRTIDTSEAFDTTMPHHRCHRNRATERYLVTGRTGVEFIDLKTGDSQRHHWTRGVCQYGFLPANGLLYMPPHSCACYIEAKLAGFYAYAPKREGDEARSVVEAGASTYEGVETASRAEGRRVTRGPAYREVEAGASSEGDWPTYRHDASRSGGTAAAVPTELQPLWEAKLGGDLTAPVVAGGKAFVASAEMHTLFALDEKNGGQAWQFTAGGRIDSPPTVAEGRVVFGCADGYVYCLRAADGELAWRSLAAPEDRRTVVRGQVESVWPVHGSALVVGQDVYCAAGRSSYIDGGISLARMDLATGRKRAERTVYSRDASSGRQPEENAMFDIPGALPDIISTDGKLLYMRKLAFDPETLESRETEPHLYCPAGFLNDDWWHRTYFIYGTHFYSGYIGWYFAGREAPAGRLLSLNDSSIYGFSYKPDYYRGATERKYHLYRADREEQSAQPEPDYQRANGEYRRLDESSFHVHIKWGEDVPLLARGLALAGDTLFAAGPPASALRSVAAFEGRKGGVLYAASTEDGAAAGEYRLDGLVRHDGLAAANGRLYIATEDGRLLCAGGMEASPAKRGLTFLQAADQVADRQPGKPVEPGLAGHWKLDGEEELAADSSGLANDAEVYGTWVKGDFGVCLRLDGDPSALTLADGDYLHFGDGDFSVSFWTKPDRYDLRIMGKEAYPQNWWVINLLPDGRVELVLGETHEPGKMVRPTSATTLPTDAWTHLAFVVDRANRAAHWYVNGALDSTTEIPETLTGNLSVEGVDLRIPSAHKPFAGLFDELRIYRRTLTAEEARKAYEGERKGRESVEFEARWP